MNRPIPTIVPESQRFWDVCQEGNFELQQCQDCGRFIFYPRIKCKFCHSNNLIYRKVTGRGTVYSYTVVNNPASKDFNEEIPYILVLVNLEEGPRLLANLIKCKPEQCGIGMEVRVELIATDKGFKLPFFIPLGKEKNS